MRISFTFPLYCVFESVLYPTLMGRVMPRDGDRILVLKRRWLDLILSGEKTLEIRSKNMKGGTYFLGCGGEIFARVYLDQAFPIKTEVQWNSLREAHCVPYDALPYKKTFGMRLLRLVRMQSPIAYVHPRGAVGIVKYRVA